ncbi:RNA-guided pseudouridylation complex pseudouridine synthase subunit Cbf5 [Nanoarchaeota archaeon]
MKKDIKELLEFGIININKPSGPTSFDISDHVRKKLKLRKTSHFGTLDPKVTGVLPIALNRACKLTGYFISKDKTYVGVMRIHEDVSLEKIKKAIAEKFTGKILQTPPVKSRVKRQEREREVKRFTLLEKDGKDILFDVECQAGTYIRKLISDLGDYLGIGAHMLELRRTQAGLFNEEESYTLYDLEKADEKALKKMIIPGEIITKLHPIVKVKEKEIDKLFSGKPVYFDDLKEKSKLKKETIICLFAKDKFIGMYQVIAGKEIFAKPLFVLQPIRGEKK